MLLPGAHTLLQIALRTGVIYFFVLIGIRLSGKREVGRMTVFDTFLAGGAAAGTTLLTSNCVGPNSPAGS